MVFFSFILNWIIEIDASNIEATIINTIERKIRIRSESIDNLNPLNIIMIDFFSNAFVKFKTQHNNNREKKNS
jgi:hypothetical protein